MLKDMDRDKNIDLIGEKVFIFCRIHISLSDTEFKGPRGKARPSPDEANLRRSKPKMHPPSPPVHSNNAFSYSANLQLRGTYDVSLYATAPNIFCHRDEYWEQLS